MPDADRDFAMRWNVVIGGQLFSRAFWVHDLQDELVTREGLLMAIALRSFRGLSVAL